MLASMKSGDAAPWAVYSIDADSWGGEAQFQNFYGCAFPIDEDGHFATCRHVLEDQQESQMLVAQHPNQKKCFRLEDILMHEECDFAIFECDTPTLFPYVWEPELYLGDEFFAYGYYDWIRKQSNLHIVPQIHKGYVTATPTVEAGTCAIPLPWYQLSFAVPSGFSGSPLYHEVGEGCFAAGMIVESIQSEINEITITSGKALSGSGIRSLAEDLGFECKILETGT